jgi:hypothetical protein
MNDEFYIGYEDRAPAGLGRVLRGVVVGIAFAVLSIIVLVAARQGRFEEGVFEFGVQREFSGFLEESPTPMLRVPGRDDGTATNFLLVGFGKFGLPPFARGHEGRHVRFKGTLIQKGAARMIEMNDAGSFQVLGEAPPGGPRPREESLGEVTLTGELVDTKCYFGVMRPATGKVHRACAVRCLSGGIPPGLLVRDQDGGAVVVLLAGPGGRKLEFEVEWAARVVRARGLLSLSDGVPVLKTEELTLARPGVN